MQNNTEQLANELQTTTTNILKILQYRDRQETAKHNISPTQHYALKEIASSEHITMSKLSDNMMLAISTMTRIVDQLVKRKLVIRLKDKKDKRICTLRLTKHGREMVKKLDDIMFESQKGILEKVEPRYRGILLNAVKAFEKATQDWVHKESDDLFLH